MRASLLLFFLVVLMAVLEACGVKGPPLPPLTATPQQPEPSTSPKPGR